MAQKSMENMLQAVATQRSNRNRPMNPPCGEGEVLRLWETAYKTFNVCLPNRYLDLLRIHNGVTENGLEIFSSQVTRDAASDLDGAEYEIPGLIEQNQAYRLDRDGYDRLIVFAEEGGVYAYAWDLDSAKYIMLPYDSDWATCLFDTFEEMITHAMKRILKDQS